MDDLFEALANNGFAQRDDVTLGYVIANALRIAQTKQNNTGYQSKAVRLVEYKVRQKQQMVEAKDIEDILNSMYPRGTWRL